MAEVPAEIACSLASALDPVMQRGKRHAEQAGQDWWTACSRRAGFVLAEMHFRDGRKKRYLGQDGTIPPSREWEVVC